MRERQFLCLLLVGCSALPSQSSRRTYPVQFGSRLNVSSSSELDERMRAPFTEGTAHAPGVSNCSELLARRARPDIPAERSTLAECVILQQLRRALPARLSYVAGLKWDEHILPLLPPQLAITVSTDAVRAAKAAAARRRSWTDVDKTLQASADQADEIVVKGSGFLSRLILWGRGDLNGDGLEDLLIQSLDALTEGTYRSTRLYVLTRKTRGGRLAVVRQLL